MFYVLVRTSFVLFFVHSLSSSFADNVEKHEGSSSSASASSQTQQQQPQKRIEILIITDSSSKSTSSSSILNVLFDDDAENEEAQELRKRIEKLRTLPSSWSNMDQVETIADTLASLLTERLCKQLASFSARTEAAFRVESIIVSFQRDVCQRDVLRKFTRYGRAPMLSEKTIQSAEAIANRLLRSPGPEVASNVILEMDALQTHVVDKTERFCVWKKIFLRGWDYLAEKRRSGGVDVVDVAILSHTLSAQAAVEFRDAESLGIVSAYLGKQQLATKWKALSLYMYSLALQMALTDSVEACLANKANYETATDFALAAFIQYIIRGLMANKNGAG